MGFQWGKVMTMNYCGKCGSANGPRALFCRQCGTDLSNQTTLSAPSAPLNVEFTAKSPSRELPPLGQQKRTDDDGKIVGQVDGESGEETPDPISISQSLRKVRASGPLIIEASMKKEQQMNQIIEQSVSGPDIEEILKKAGQNARLPDIVVFIAWTSMFSAFYLGIAALLEGRKLSPAPIVHRPV